MRLLIATLAHSTLAHSGSNRRIGYCRSVLDCRRSILNRVGRSRRGLIEIGRWQSVRFGERQVVVDRKIGRRDWNRSRLADSWACADIAPQCEEDPQRDQTDQREPKNSRHSGPSCVHQSNAFSRTCRKFAPKMTRALRSKVFRSPSCLGRRQSPQESPRAELRTTVFRPELIRLLNCFRA